MTKHTYSEKDKDCLQQAMSFIREVRNQIETDFQELEKLDGILGTLEEIVECE